MIALGAPSSICDVQCNRVYNPVCAYSIRRQCYEVFYNQCMLYTLHCDDANEDGKFQGPILKTLFTLQFIF